MLRAGLLAPNEHYHLCNRGVSKQVIFHNNRDYYRFLFLILYFQSPVNFPQVSRTVEEFVKHPMLDIKKEVINKRTVELVAFCIMPNHFHLLVKELEEGGISSYMQRILNAYSKYYNTKYQKSGHVFQGSYRAVHIENNQQLLHLSAYIHRNPREISRWFNRENQYSWSSYPDYLEGSRWGDLLMPQIILEQFSGENKYQMFVKTSTTKLVEEELGYRPTL